MSKPYARGDEPKSIIIILGIVAVNPTHVGMNVYCFDHEQAQKKGGGAVD